MSRALHGRRTRHARRSRAGFLQRAQGQARRQRRVHHARRGRAPVRGRPNTRPPPSRRGRRANRRPQLGRTIFVLERQAGPFKTTGRIQDVRPGDIVQFRDTLLSGPDGNFGTYTMRSHRHTAVVAQLDDSGTAIKIFHQNSNGYKKVTARWIQLTDLQQGRFDIYRPIARTRRPSHEKPADDSYDARRKRDKTLVGQAASLPVLVRM